MREGRRCRRPTKGLSYILQNKYEAIKNEVMGKMDTCSGARKQRKVVKGSYIDKFREWKERMS